jgi:hypothetical protein
MDSTRIRIPARGEIITYHEEGRMKNRLRTFTVAMLMAALCGLPDQPASASPTGFTGRTQKPGFTPGCGSCHGNTASAAFLLKVPATIMVSQSAPCTLFANPTGNFKGLDIAAFFGTLAAGSGLQVQNGEVTHTNANIRTSAVFTYTAPSTPQTDTLYATGMVSFSVWGYAPKVLVNVTGATSVKEEQPSTFALRQNYPNPFNPATRIAFSLAHESEVTLKVYTLLGEEVASLLTGRLAAGEHQVPFDARAFASGAYIYRLVVRSAADPGRSVFSSSRKMLLTR